MTYDFYKNNFGKLTKAQRNSQPLWRRRLQMELQEEAERATAINAWRVRAEATDSDLPGLLYDKLQEAKEEVETLRDEVERLKACLKEKEVWVTNGA